MSRSDRIGVFVDATNVRRNGGYGMRFDVLRAFACRDGAQASRLNAYLTLDEVRMDEDEAYRSGQNGYADNLRDFGFKVVHKPLKRFTDDEGGVVLRGSVDVDLAVDMLGQARHLDRVLLVTGNGDLAPAVRALQADGVRVELLAFDNVSGDLRRTADLFTSGFLVPNLLPIDQPADHEWGEAGSRVRGVCYSHTGRGYGFLRFLPRLSPDLWVTDTREEKSPWQSAFCHDSELPPGLDPRRLPSRHHVFEFTVEPGEGEDRTWQAVEVDLAEGR